MTAPQSGSDPEEEQAELVAFLESGRAFPGSPSCRRIDTHAASIFLAGDRAWKLKRSVRYPYLDFTTPARRRAALESELRLNRRTAPDLYLAVHPLARTADGFAIDGDGEAVDWILEMRRFPDDALFDQIVRKGAGGEPLMLRLADCLCHFHEKAEPRLGTDGADALRRVIEGNAESLEPHLAIFGRDRVKRLLQSHRLAADRHGPLLDARSRKGKVRRVHGDLHLGNIALVEGVPVPFDCLEFSEELATTDVMYDLAFLLMDLLHRELHTPANLIFNRYVDLSGDEDGVRLLPLFMSIRATIRAHVLATQCHRDACAATGAEARLFLGLAERLMMEKDVALLATGGLSGTGKSVLARAIGGDLGRAPGARILRSDVLRKRLAGLAPEQPLPTSLYTPLANRTIYNLLSDCAARHLSFGTYVIVDAVLRGRDERRMMRRAADHAHVPFVGLWLEASEATRLERVARRTADASDADAAIVRAQSRTKASVPPGWAVIVAEGSAEEVAATARDLARRRSGEELS